MDTQKLFGMMMRESAEYDVHILEAIRRIRGMFEATLNLYFYD